MATKFTASEHLNGPGPLSKKKNVYRSMICELHCVERCLELLLRKSMCFRHELVNQANLPRVLMCLSKHSPDAVVAHFVHVRAFVCLPVLFSVSPCIRDMH